MSESSTQLADLPAELIDSILSFLSPVDLTAVSATCSPLRRHAIADTLWQPLVQENTPGVALSTPYPFTCYRDLYAAHDTKWFLPKYKVWFCDRDLVGKILIARYDQRRGCIEAYQLVAVPSGDGVQNWLAPGPIQIHDFEPRVSLHRDKPVLKFAANVSPDSRRARELTGLRGRGFAPEVPMVVDENPDTMFCNFLLAKPMPPSEILPKVLQPFPYGYIWPPPSIPAPHRVVGAPSFHDDHPHVRPSELPEHRAEASERTFRIKQWIEMTAGAPGLVLGQGLTRMVRALAGEDTPPPDGGAVDTLAGLPELAGVHLGEEVITYSTLDPALYTPTPLKPWRGIWVGDYSGHGCEFLLVHQPDDELPPTDEELGLVRGEGEADEDWKARRLERRVHSGSLEGIKLTGDPNIPRGEHTFVVEDLSDGGYVSEAHSPFYGARLAVSKGHIARRGFQGGKFSFSSSSWKRGRY